MPGAAGRRRIVLLMAAARIGKGMVFGAWVVFLALVAWLFQGELERRFNPNPEPVVNVAESGEQEVVLRRNRSGHYVATGEVNGEPVQFLVDTGATDVAMSEATGRRLGLRPGAPVTLSTANGLVRGARTTIDSIAIGPIRLEGVAAVLSPGIDESIVLLGMSFLRDLELVQRDGQLILRR